MVEISGGPCEIPVRRGVFSQLQKVNTAARVACLQGFASEVQATVQTPLMVTGGFRTDPAEIAIEWNEDAGRQPAV